MSEVFLPGLVRLGLLSLETAGKGPEMEAGELGELIVGFGAPDLLCDLGKVP